jgi:hypothetical protein
MLLLITEFFKLPEAVKSLNYSLKKSRRILLTYLSRALEVFSSGETVYVVAV